MLSKGSFLDSNIKVSRVTNVIRVGHLRPYLFYLTKRNILVNNVKNI